MNYLKKNDNKLVSVIVPIYNNEQHLDECINSILNQSYTNIELILVDDGSTDKSLSICRTYLEMDSRVSIIYQENNGPGSARNNGLKNCLGSYVIFCDSDDIVEKDWIRYLIGGFNEKQVELSICGIASFHDDLLEDNIFQIHNRILIENQEYLTMDIFLESLLTYKTDVYFGSNNNKLYLKKIIIDNNIKFNENSIFAEDFEFNLDYYLHVNNISLIKDNHYYYRRDNNNSLHKARKNLMGLWKRYETLFLKYNHLMIKNNIQEQQINQFLLFAIKNVMFSEFSKYKKFDSRNVLKIIDSIFAFVEINEFKLSSLNSSNRDKLLINIINKRKRNIFLILVFIVYIYLKSRKFINYDNNLSFE